MATIVDKKRERESTGFLIKQRAFLKLYIITAAQKGPIYGLQFLDDLIKEFKPYGFEPVNAEIYRSLHDLMEAGILKRGKVKKDGAKYQEIAEYRISDNELARAYKELVKVDLDRCEQLLRKAIKDNFS